MNKICDECETVAHCTKHGCIPKQQALDKMAENAKKLGLDYESAAGTQVSKVWWDGGKLMAQPIPLEQFYKEPEQPAQQCKWPTCQREDYQQVLAEQIKRELVGEQPTQEPVGYEHHEYRPYGAPGEVRIHAVLASQYKMPDGTIADDFKWLIDGYKADPNTIKLLPLYTSPPAQRKPLTRDQVKKLITATGYDTASPQERTDFINGIRHAETAHGIKENT